MQRESQLWPSLFGSNTKSSQRCSPNGTSDEHHSCAKIELVKRKRAKAARVVGKTFFALLAMLLLHLPSAGAEDLIDGGGPSVNSLILKAKAEVRDRSEDIPDLEVIIPVICLVEIILVIICWCVLRSKLDKEYKVGQVLDRASFGLVH